MNCGLCEENCPAQAISRKTCKQRMLIGSYSMKLIKKQK
ncbi:MAG: 4Fe-4S binding protein [Lachnospiraceae bacterium]|nr:4Fe-4S binding protein [Lachnospiraceae bacterium]